MPYSESFLYIAESVLLMILITVKLVFFYDYIKIGRFTPVMCAATLGIITALYLAVIKITRINPAAFLKFIYTVVCIFLFIDRIYFSYLQKMPSFSSIGMAYQLTDITGTLIRLVTINHAVYVLDLPLWLLFGVNFKKYASAALAVKGSAEYISRCAKCVSAVFTSLCVVFVGTSLFRADFQLSYLKNEIITYHASDALGLLFRAPEEPVDAKAYIPATAGPTTPYFGIASGRNVITIQVEALQSFVIGLIYNGQEVTPNLNALIAGESLYFSNYYYQIGGGNTSDAEFAVNNSLYAPANEAAYIKYEKNDFYGLPWLLKDNGYSGAYAFHGYKGEFWNREKAYPGQGFDDYISEEDLTVTDIFNMGISDKQFFSQSVKRMEQYTQPFYAFMITLSSHYPYIIPEQYRELKLLPRDEGTLAGDYIQSIRYVDSAIGMFIDDLKKAGLYDNSIISIYGDHYAIPSSDAGGYRMVSELVGHGYYEEDIFKVPFIVNIPGSGINETIETIGGHIDNLPTMLHLLGIENRRSIMFGQCLLTAEKGIVYEQTHMARGSFISDDVIFYYPDNGILANAAAIDRKTGTIITPDINGYKDIIAAAQQVYADCDALLANNKAIIN